MVKTRTMQYTSKATAAFARYTEVLRTSTELEASSQKTGEYTLTSELAPWVKNAMANFRPGDKVLDLVKPFSAAFHVALDAERRSSSGLHDLNVIELTYQVTLEVAAAVLLAADTADNPIDLQNELHSSRAGGDEQFAPWGLLLTGLECDPPIIAMFPFYLMMCQAFTFESTSAQENYVYTALTGIDWAKPNSEFSNKIALFEKTARHAVPKLDDNISKQDRSFWRIGHAYLNAINDCENSMPRPFRAPQHAAIPHDINIDLIIAMRGFDTIGTSYMCSDGAAWLDNAGIGALIGSALVNDVMDLHTDIKIGETRNLLRLLYPGLDMEQAKFTVSTFLSSLLCELFRGHYGARHGNREDGRIVAAAPAYSFCRAQHRRIFETLERYIDLYPKFWDWTWEIYQTAKDQVTEFGLSEPIFCALKRAGKPKPLPQSPATSFYDSYYTLVEITEPLKEKRPLGVSDNLSQVVSDLHCLWHIKLRAPNKERGWGRRFDVESDKLFGDAGRVLSESSNADHMYKFAIAYGRLSMTLPYIAYHTVDAIIMAFGIQD